MDKETLQKLVEKRYSTYQIAQLLGRSQTNVRYWLSKFDLKTNPIIVRKTKEQKRKRHRDYVRNRYHNDPEFRKKAIESSKRYSNRSKLEVKKLVTEWKSNGCAFYSCNETSEVALVAHHLDESTKSFNIGDAVYLKKSARAVRQELSKCICICRNCHAKVHADIKTIDTTTCHSGGI